MTHFFQMKANNPIFDYPIVDSKEYVDNAQYYLEKNFLGPPGSFFHPPFYSYFVALIFKLFGFSTDIVKMVQVALDLLNLLLLYLLAGKIFNRATALLSSSIYALYIPIIQFNVEILPPVLIIFLLLSSTLLFIRACESKQRKNGRYIAMSILSGFLFGLLIITLPNFLPCLPFILLWLVFFVKEISPAKRYTVITAFTLFVMIPVMAVAARNYLYAGEKVLLSHNGGINLYIGNNPDINKTVSLRPGIEWEELLMYPYTQERIETFEDQSRFWIKEVFSYILSNPLKWIKDMVKKGILFFNSYEFPRNFSYKTFEEYSFIAKLPFMKLNLVMPLGIGGLIILAFPKFRNNVNESVYLPVSVFFIYSCTIILFFVSGRYRLPVIPFLIMFSSFFIYSFYCSIKERNIKIIAIMTALLPILTVALNINYFSSSYPYKINPSYSYTLTGKTLLSNKKYDQALRFFRKGENMPIDDSTYQIYRSLGHFHAETGDKERAMEYFGKAIELNPRDYRAAKSLGFEHKMRGHFDKALQYLDKAREIAPCFPEIYMNAADCYIGKGDLKKAVSTIESYKDYCPSPHPAINVSLAKLYMDKYRMWEKAKMQLILALEYHQGEESSPETYNRLGACYYHLGDMSAARKTWLKGLEKAPDYKAIKINMGMLKSRRQ